MTTLTEQQAALSYAVFGDLVDAEALFAKMSPDSADVHAPGLVAVRVKKRPVRKLDDAGKRRLTAAGSFAGAGVGAYGLGVAANEIRTRAKEAGSFKAGLRKTPRATKLLIPAEIAGVGIEGYAGHLLHGDAKKKPVGKGWRALVDSHVARSQLLARAHEPVLQRLPGAKHAAGVTPPAAPAAAVKPPKPVYRVGPDAGKGKANPNLPSQTQVRGARSVRDTLEQTGRTTGGKVALGVGAGGVAYGLHSRKQDSYGYDPYAKADTTDDFTIAGSFSKFDGDKQRAYGWASVVTHNGQPVVDRQGDYISLDDIEEAAYVYVRKSRVTGDMHRRTHDDQPHKIGELIESVVFTPEKCRAMGIPEDVAGRWWMGVQVDDPADWEVVKKDRTGFSIHGIGRRQATDIDDIYKMARS